MVLINNYSYCWTCLAYRSVAQSIQINEVYFKYCKECSPAIIGERNGNG